METLTYNLGWMSWNVFLAIIAAVSGYLMTVVHPRPAKYLFFFIWLLFVPNTVYVITDTYHIFPQFPDIFALLIPILMLQYIILLVLGIFTYIKSLQFLEKLLDQLKVHTFRVDVIIVVFNFFIAFGVMLGRFQRTNSWEVLTDPIKVVYDALALSFTPERMVFVLTFGFFCNLLYFGLRRRMRFIK